MELYETLHLFPISRPSQPSCTVS